MSKFLVKWGLDTRKREDRIRSIIDLVSKSRNFFPTNPKIMQVINNFVIKNIKQVDITYDDFLLYLFSHQENNESKYWDWKALIERFFEETLPLIFQNFNSFKIGDEHYINVVSSQKVTNIYLESKPLTNFFLTKNLRLKPFNYTINQISIIKRLLDFIIMKNSSGKNQIMHFFSLYFLSSKNNQKALVTTKSFSETLNEKVNLDMLETYSVNYKVIIKKIIGEEL